MKEFVEGDRDNKELGGGNDLYTSGVIKTVVF